MTDWLRPIDIYCERTGPEFWSEPLNALSNAAFLLAAFLAAHEARRKGRMDGAIGLLCALAAIIGIGSFLFHSFANRWSLLADVIPIQIFTFAALLIYLRRMAGFSALLAIGAALATGGLAALTRRPLQGLFGPWFNGSEGYLAPLAMMIATALYLAAKGHGAARGLGAAAAVFTVSLGFRALDRSICGAFPLGAHWAWHSLNAVVIWLIIVTLIRSDRTAP